MPSEESCASVEVASISPLTLPFSGKLFTPGRRVSGEVEREGEERVQTVGKERRVLAQAHARMEGQQ